MRGGNARISYPVHNPTAAVLGHAWVFVGAVVVLIIWPFTGPLLGFSDTWQLAINTGSDDCHLPCGLHHHSEHPEP